MRLFSHIFGNQQAEVDAPPRPTLRYLRLLFVLFVFSFVFDYRNPELDFGATTTGGSLFQYAFIGVAVLCGGLLSFLGLRHLFIRPGCYLVFGWWAFALGSLTVSLLWGNELGRVVRLFVPLLLVGLAINATLVVAAAGMRPGEAVRWLLLAGLINVAWRFVFGWFLSGVPHDEMRMEILSPSIGFLFAWSACAFVLRPRFTAWSLLIFGLPFAVAAISVTRSLAFPIIASFGTAAFCLVCGLVWRMYDLRFPVKKLGGLAAVGLLLVVSLAAAVAVQPDLADRWYQRMFDNRGENGATTEDLSSLMRKAEAQSMWDIVSKTPQGLIFGRGLGTSYYWDESYYPEIFLVYPDDRHQFPLDIYTAGHSVWTYTLFSTGIIGILVTLSAFFVSMGMSLHSGLLLSRTVMGLRSWDSFLVFLPFVAMWATLSESIFRNPFDERFTGIIFGFMIAMPQFFYNRNFYLRFREKIGQESPQLILDDADLGDIEEFVDGHHCVSGVGRARANERSSAF